MSTHIAIIPGKLYPQPNGSIQVDKEGKWTATQIYLCHRASAVALMPRIGSCHPELAFITLTSASVGYSEGDVAEITCQYSGVEKKDNEKAHATFSMGLSVSEEPILTHHRYKDLPAYEVEAIKFIMAGKDKDDQGNDMEDFVETALGKEVLAKVERGETSYYSPKITWKESWQSDEPVKSVELNMIAKIDTPEGPVPALAVNRNWLRNGVTQEQDGKAFRIEIEWLASNPGGWDADLYSPS